VSRHRLLSLMLGGALIFALQASVASAKQASSCSDPAGCISIGPGDPVRVGTFVVSERGVIGTESALAVEFAADSRGDIAGHPIQLTHLGDGCQPDLATTTAEAVAAEATLVGIIGPTCSVAAREIAGILGGAGITTISPSTTAPDLTEAGQRDPFYFRVAYNDVYHADALVDFLVGEGHESLAVVVADTPAFGPMGQRVADLFVAANGDVTDLITVAADDDNFSTELADIAASEPDAVVFFTFQGAAFVSQARATPGLEATPLATTSDVAETLLGQIGDVADAEGLIAAAPDFGFLTTEPYLSTLGGAFADAARPFLAYAYDASNLLFDAIASFQQGGSQRLTIGRTVLRDAVATTAAYPGVTGSITCGPTGDCNAQQFVIQIVVDGALTPL